MRRTIGVAVVALGLLLSGCSTENGPDGEKPEPTGAATPPSSLRGLSGEYQVTIADGRPGLSQAPDAQLRFADGRLSYQGGCNVLEGDVRWDGHRMVLDDFDGTELSCSTGLSARDDWYRSFLDSSPRVTVDGADAELASGDQYLRLVRIDPAPRPDPAAAALRGREWRVGAGKALTLRFSGAEGVQIGGDCHAGDGRVRLVGDRLLMSTIGDVERCGQPARDQVQGLIATLSSHPSFAVTGDRLVLTPPQGSPAETMTLHG